MKTYPINSTEAVSPAGSLVHHLVSGIDVCLGTISTGLVMDSCFLKKQVKEHCDSWMAACKAQRRDWDHFPVSVWFTLFAFKCWNWPKRCCQTGRSEQLELLIPCFLFVCKKPEGCFYSKSSLSHPLGSVCTAWAWIQGIFFPPLFFLFPSYNSDGKGFKGGCCLPEAIVTG